VLLKLRFLRLAGCKVRFPDSAADPQRVIRTLAAGKPVAVPVSWLRAILSDRRLLLVPVLVLTPGAVLVRSLYDTSGRSFILNLSHCLGFAAMLLGFAILSGILEGSRNNPRYHHRCSVRALRQWRDDLSVPLQLAGSVSAEFDFCIRDRGQRSRSAAASRLKLSRYAQNLGTKWSIDRESCGEKNAKTSGKVIGPKSNLFYFELVLHDGPRRVSRANSPISAAIEDNGET